MNTLEMLRAFCSTDPTRPGLHRPFSYDPWTYATDGRIVLRVPLIPETPFPYYFENPSRESVESISFEPCPLALELPRGWENFAPELETCDACDGTGKARRDCPKCEGTGRVTCTECGHDHDCDECDGGTIGDATAQCEDCDGTGQSPKFLHVTCSRGLIAVPHQYLALIHRCLPYARITFRDADPPLHIAFPGGDGALMPSRMSRVPADLVAKQWPELSTQP